MDRSQVLPNLSSPAFKVFADNVQLLPFLQEMQWQARDTETKEERLNELVYEERVFHPFIPSRYALLTSNSKVHQPHDSGGFWRSTWWESERSYGYRDTEDPKGVCLLLWLLLVSGGDYLPLNSFFRRMSEESVNVQGHSIQVFLWKNKLRYLLKRP